MPWLILTSAFAVFCVCSYCTYEKSIRDSSWYLPIFVAGSLIGGYLWVSASRRLDSTNSILLLSLVWDFLMVIAYYAAPLAFAAHKVSWWAVIAACVTIGGLIWFKLSIE
jgi:hypothetical protein